MQLLVAQVQRGGHGVKVVEWPDRIDNPSQRRFPEVAVDALLDIDGVLWAVDVMSLARPESDLNAERLDSALQEVARAHARVIHVRGPCLSTKELGRIERVARKAITNTPAGGSCDVAGVTVSWRQPQNDESPNAVVSLLLDATADCADQIRESSGQPLVKKATKQARRAREVGCKTAVALDWTGHAGIAQGTHFLAQHASTVRAAVADVLNGVDHELEAVVLLDRRDSWHLMRGGIPWSPVRAGRAYRRITSRLDKALLVKPRTVHGVRMHSRAVDG